MYLNVNVAVTWFWKKWSEKSIVLLRFVWKPVHSGTGQDLIGFNGISPPTFQGWTSLPRPPCVGRLVGYVLQKFSCSVSMFIVPSNYDCKITNRIQERCKWIYERSYIILYKIIYDLSYIHLHHSHSTGILRTHKVTSSQWLDSSVGRALHRYRRGHEFESRSGLNFFRL